MSFAEIKKAFAIVGRKITATCREINRRLERLAEIEPSISVGITVFAMTGAVHKVMAYNEWKGAAVLATVGFLVGRPIVKKIADGTPRPSREP